MGHHGNLVPVEAGGRLDRFLEFGLTIAVRDGIQPVAVAAVLGHAVLIGPQQHRAFCPAQALDLDQAELARAEVQARQIVAQVLLVDVVDFAPLRRFVLDGHAHGNGLGLEVGAQQVDLGAFALGVR